MVLRLARMCKLSHAIGFGGSFEVAHLVAAYSDLSVFRRIEGFDG